MKSIYTIILLFLLAFTGKENSTKHVPEWFKYFTEELIEINKNYLDALDKSNQIREKYNFESLYLSCTGSEEIELSVKGLDYFYISFENKEKRLITGELNHAFFTDKMGKKHPVNFSAENLETGTLRRFNDNEGLEWFQIQNGIYKISCKSQFVKFEAKTPQRNKFIRFDVAYNYDAGLELERRLTELESDVLHNFPASRQKTGFGLELKEGLIKYRLNEASLGSLADFYIEHSLEQYRDNLNVEKERLKSSADLYNLRESFVLSKRIKDAIKRVEGHKQEAVKMAISDCMEQFPEKFQNGYNYLSKLDKFESNKSEILTALKAGDKDVLIEAENYFSLFDKALLENPILDFDQLICIKRDATDSHTRMPKQFGFPSLNSHNNTRIPPINGPWHNTISVLSDLSGKGELNTIIDPGKFKLITDLELNFNGKDILYSSVNENKLWHVYETDITGKEIECVTPDSLPDVNHFDACYLPDGNIIFTSDATYQGLPCEGGSRPMTVLYLLDRKTGKIRQLTFEQDSDFCPVVLNSGRVMYLRWEYSDLAHYFSRILMSCNPDGTGQTEYYGSNSYFPNSFFFARPIPDHPTMVVGVAGGHHGISRSGRLLLLDPMKGRSEADGVVHEIPRRGIKVDPIIKDELVKDVWPQFLHPYPLNDKYFIVSAKMDENSLWGIYLVDVFDNMTLIKEVEGSGLFDPIPVKKQKVPRVIPSKINEKDKEATVFITDIYQGNGLKGIPRGMVKKLRLFSYHYGHISTGGHHTVGVESSWDIKRILGTVPVEEDGSAMFKVPANLPISIQPLDSTGKALQIMRSWFVGMPGENVSCIGCHERQNQASPNVFTMASRKRPAKIETWQGNPRPFSYRYEVQPVLDKYCVSCHNGQKESIPDFRKSELISYEGHSRDQIFLEDKAYMSLHPYVRRPGPEGDIHLLKPMEYHAGTSELIQMLQRDHHGVDLDDKDWEKLYAWIDLNAPYRGKWSPPEFRDFDQDERRKCLTERYANVTIDPEAEYDSLVTYMENLIAEPVQPQKSIPVKYEVPAVKGWPFTTEEAKKRQSLQAGETMEFEIGNGQKFRFKGIPSGKYIKASREGYEDERKPVVVEIDKPFYMSEFEITNAQYALFDPKHDSRFIDQQWKDHTTPGYPANLPDQPVIRISYNEAIDFCKWLSEKTRKKVSLPSEDQWEWACRAGSDKDFWFSSSGSDFGTYENLSDNEVRKFAVTGVNPHFIGDEDPRLNYYAFIPRDKNVNDGNMISSAVGSYQPNPWGLYDMHGNVAEWTTSGYRTTGLAQDKYYSPEMKIVKGGSWRDRPKRSVAGSKRYYLPFQKVYNVGFRVIISEE